MTDIVREWIAKAEADYESLSREYRSSVKPNLDLECFLAQQCVEKYLKGYLQFRDIPFGRTHDLVVLLDLAIPSEPLWESWRSAFRRLKDFATEFRYPGEWADPSHAKFSFDVATRFREEARKVLSF